MPTLLHLSDLHFGSTFNEHLADLILADIQKLQPNVVVISGDFTLRGRIGEYRAARAYLDKIARPVLAIPGNHDHPLFEPIERFARPLRRYRNHIHPDINAAFCADGLCIVGLNDNHPLLPGGFWARAQRAWLAAQLQAAPREACKIVVTHHHLVWLKPRPTGFWYPAKTLRQLAGLGVELVLSGHTHVPLIAKTPSGIIAVQAGTATSTRTRQGLGNTYNRITITPGQIAVAVQQYDAGADAFTEARVEKFARDST
jgi:3',5'-cyclic AMP phosphodiesterase CpdA